MAKIKNTGNAPRGFIDDQGLAHTVAPGEEAEVNLTEADYENLQELLKKVKEDAKDNPAEKDKPPPFELGGGAGGKARGESISPTGHVSAPEDRPAPKSKDK